MIKSPNTPASPIGAGAGAGVDAVEVDVWQLVVDLMEDAARACDAHADLPGVDRWLWRFDGEMVRSAADQLRMTAPASLPVSFPDRIIGPAGYAAGLTTPPGADTDPLPLLEQASQALEQLPDDPADVDLLLATFAIADVLAAVRAHYE